MPSSIGSVVGGLFGGLAPSVPNVSTFQYPQLGNIAQDYLSTQTANLTNPYSTYSPQATQTFQSQYGNPYAAGYQSAAGTAGQTYGATGTQAAAASPQINSAALAALGPAAQILNTGFDPQSQLYNRLSQQTTDLANVQGAQTGVSNSPYGASLVNNAQNNFNIDWQNQQLNRQLAALGGYGGAVQDAGAGAGTAANLGITGAGAQLTGGQVPFGTANAVTDNQSAALQNLLQVLGTSGAGRYNQNNLASLLSYLGAGAGQANVGADLALKNYQNQLAAQQDNQSGLGSLVSNALPIIGTALQFS